MSHGAKVLTDLHLVQLLTTNRVLVLPNGKSVSLVKTYTYRSMLIRFLDNVRRTVVSIPNGPSALAVKEAAWGLARYAAISQVRKYYDKFGLLGHSAVIGRLNRLLNGDFTRSCALCRTTVWSQSLSPRSCSMESTESIGPSRLHSRCGPKFSSTWLKTTSYSKAFS